MARHKRNLKDTIDNRSYRTYGVRVIVGCEFSGEVREAFARRGHDAWSCDLLPSEKAGKHIQDDVLKHLNEGWDLGIFHPACTHTAVSGARWFKDKQREQDAAVEFFYLLMNAPILRIALEQPISIISTRICRPTQIIQPYDFGHGETKATCLWLKYLPPLRPTHKVDGRAARVHREPPGPERWKNRSRTLRGVAEAMASQWGTA